MTQPTSVAAAGPQPPAAAPATDLTRLEGEVRELVDAHFYDATRARDWARRNARYAAALDSLEAFERRTRELLLELRASHTQYFAASDVRAKQILAIFAEPDQRIEQDSIGAQFVEIDSAWFAARVFPGRDRRS